MATKVPISIPDDDKVTLEIIKPLQKRKRLSTLVRDLLNLHAELTSGKTDMLFQMFPFLEDALRNQLCGDTPPKNGGSMALTRTIPQKSIDIDDLGQLEIKRVTKSADNNATYNFLISSSLNVYGDIHGLPPEVVEYGIRTKRIPENMVKKSQAKKGAPKAMAVPDVAMEIPDFDDIEL